MLLMVLMLVGCATQKQNHLSITAETYEGKMVVTPQTPGLKDSLEAIQYYWKR